MLLSVPISLLMRRRLAATWTGLALACWALVPSAAPGEVPDSDAQAELVGLLRPTLGRPVFVEPGGTFQLVARISDAVGPAEFTLIRAGPPEQRYKLQAPPGALEKLAGGQPLPLTVPATVPSRTYDLEIRCGGRRLVERHCVAVARVGSTLRLVHLGNMNLGDSGAPHFDQRLIDEINLVAPTLIVATGDYLDATHADPTTGWQQLVDQFVRFEAPIVMACGDHDDIGLYSRYVAPSPIGLLPVGPHRCLIVFDHPQAPIHRNAEQLRWVEHTLATLGSKGVTFLVTHDDSPSLLRYWQQQGTLSRMIHTGRIGLWFAGGHRDWDGRAYRELIGPATPMLYVRTHQSSAAPRDGATGVSHYRIVDVVDDRVILPQDPAESRRAPPSTPVGRLQATFDGANDGSESELAFCAVNNLPYRLDRLGLWLRLRKVQGQMPWCRGAQFEQIIDLGSEWECCVRFDLPDKGALRGVAGSGPPAAVPAVAVRFEGPQRLDFDRHTTPDGLEFLSLVDDPPLVYVQNNGDEVAAVSPLIRLDGDLLAYRPLDEETRFATAYRLRLQPGEVVCLQLDLSAVRVAPGRRELQAYLRGIGVMIPFCHAVNIVAGG